MLAGLMRSREDNAYVRQRLAIPRGVAALRSSGTGAPSSAASTGGLVCREIAGIHWEKIEEKALLVLLLDDERRPGMPADPG